jgi:hypothetical protein
MRTKILYCFLALFVVNVLFIGCKKDLTIKPNDLLLDQDIFTDKNLINSTLARFYQQIHTGTNVNGNGNTGWGQQNGDWNSFQQDPDDGVNNNGGPSTGDLTLSRDRYKIMDYGLIRRLNQFIEGIRSDASKKAMTPGENANFEAQALFIRAWVYFLTVRSLGGVTIVGDKVFTYDPGQDVTPYQLPRDSEEDCYKYILDQCDLAAARFTAAGSVGISKTTNSATTNKWAALMLKARAALYAASIAKYTPLRAPGNVKKDKRGVDVVGIPVAKATDFYTIAFNTADEVIKNSPYVLQTSATNPELAFYQATTIKSGNTEVIWAFDRKSPSVNSELTRFVAPVSQGHSDGQTEGNSLGPTLNLVEAFENRDGSNPRILDRVGYATNGNYVIYDDVQAPFKAKDARLYGTVIWPEAPFRGTPVPLRAGELTKITQPYTYATNAPNRTNNTLPTGPNGPFDASTANLNKTGFNLRKWVDETPNSGIAPNYSEVWWPKFRIAEAYLVAAEAGLELGGTARAAGLTYINKIRVDRGKITPLTDAQFTFDKIINENRVEFAFEDHRVWDLRRWRLAHVFWNGVLGDTYPTSGVQPTSQAMTLYAYRINVPGNPGNNNGKWVFERKVSYRRITTPFNFREDSYYSTITQEWVNPRNPNWVGNPYQTF